MKNILIIAGQYFPFATPCSFRMHSFAKYLSRSGYQPYILALPWTRELVDLNSYFGIGAFDSSYINRDTWPVIKIKCSVKRPPFLNRLLFDLLGIDSYPELQKSSKKTIQELWNKSPFKAIIATRPQSFGFDSLKLAHWASKFYKVPWIADFRDVEGQHNYPEIIWKDLPSKPGRIVGQILYPLRSKIRSHYDIVLCRNAFACTTVSQGLINRLNLLGLSRVELLLNGYEPDEYEYVDAEKTNKFRIIYAGALHQERDPSLLFDALDQLIKDRNEEFIQSLDLTFYGVGQENIARFLEGRACRSIVNCSPRVSKRSIQRKMKGSSILLHLSHANAKGIMTSKLTEYLGAKRPIMTIPGDNDVVDAFLKDTNAGVSLGKIDAIKAYLLKQFEHWKLTGDTLYQSDKLAKKIYTREHQTMVLAKLLDEAIQQSC